MGRGQKTRAPWVLEAIRAHHVGLVAYAQALLRDHERAKEVAQESLLRLCAESRALESDQARARAWLYRVCRNLCIDHLRKTKRLTLVAQTPSTLEPMESALARELSPDVRAALATLPEREREIVRLRFAHGLAYREIAEVMELSATNVGFILHTALKKMREVLEQPPLRMESSS